MEKSKILLLFDIDGTLLVSGGAGNRALNKTLQEKYSIQDAMKDIVPDGKTDPAIIREIFKNFNREPNDQEIEEICQTYLWYLEKEIEKSTGYRILQGVDSLLKEACRQSHIIMGLLTGNLKRGAEIKLERSHLNSFFSFGGFGSDFENRNDIAQLAIMRGRECAEEWVPLEKIFVIGDTPYDIKCAKASGVKSIAVASGSITLTQLSDNHPDYLMENLSDQAQFMKLIHMYK